MLHQKSETFSYQEKPKSIAQICCRLSPQCTKTIDECLWPQKEWVRIDRNLKIVGLIIVFKLPRFPFQDAQKQVMSCSFEEITQLISFSWCSRIIL